MSVQLRGPLIHVVGCGGCSTLCDAWHTQGFQFDCAVATCAWASLAPRTHTTHVHTHTHYTQHPLPCVSRLNAFNYNKLLPRATTGAALMQNGSLMARFAAPTCWNLLHIVHMDGKLDTQGTTTVFTQVRVGWVC